MVTVFALPSRRRTWSTTSLLGVPVLFLQTKGRVGRVEGYSELNEKTKNEMKK